MDKNVSTESACKNAKRQSNSGYILNLNTRYFVWIRKIRGNLRQSSTLHDCVGIGKEDKVSVCELVTRCSSKVTGVKSGLSSQLT
jgi:hypothetical protein